MIGLIAAGATVLVALVAALFGRRNPWKKRAETTLARAEQAGQTAIQERTAAAEQEVAHDLAEVRDQPGDDRVAGALERARRRRAGGPPAGAGGS